MGRDRENTARLRNQIGYQAALRRIDPTTVRLIISSTATACLSTHGQRPVFDMPLLVLSERGLPMRGPVVATAETLAPLRCCLFRRASDDREGKEQSLDKR